MRAFDIIRMARLCSLRSIRHLLDKQKVSLCYRRTSCAIVSSSNITAGAVQSDAKFEIHMENERERAHLTLSSVKPRRRAARFFRPRISLFGLENVTFYRNRNAELPFERHIIDFSSTSLLN